MYCKNCGKEIEEGKVYCLECERQLEAENMVIKEMPVKEKKSYYSNVIQTIIALFLILLTAVTVFNTYEAKTTKPAYEYMVKMYFGDLNDRTGSTFSETAAANSIDVGEAELNALGQEGWEIVTSYLENETAWPNFGNSDYVTGLQPNIRPQRLVVILKREI